MVVSTEHALRLRASHDSADAPLQLFIRAKEYREFGRSPRRPGWWNVKGTKDSYLWVPPLNTWTPDTCRVVLDHLRASLPARCQPEAAADIVVENQRRVVRHAPRPRR